MSFADLKRKSQNNFDFLQKELEKSSSNKNVDDRFWKPEVDASGNGYAVIRFLPAPEGETIPWAKLYSMPSKVLVVGTLRTHSPLLATRIPLVK